MKGLLIALGKPKGEPEKEEAAEESPEKAYAREAFAALKEDDEEGFVEALLGLKACGSKE